MKKHYLLGACMFAAVLTACTDEDRALSGVREGILTATVESSSVSSRVGFTNPGGDFYWSKGDRLGVTTVLSPTLFTPLTIAESGIGKASASFSGIVSGTVEGYAVYPYNDYHGMSETTLTYRFPSEYTYETLDADFTTATQGYGNSFNPPMWGEISNGSVELKHLGGVFCIKIDKLPAGNDLKMTLTSDKKLNGSYTVSLAASDNAPKIDAVTTTVEAEKTVTIRFTNTTADATGVFYVPAPVGTHTLRLKVWDGTNEAINTALGTVTIARKALKVFSLSDGVLNAGAATEVNNVGDVVNALSNSNSVLLTAAVTGDNNTVTIPTVTNGAPAQPKTVAFSQINGGASLSIVDANVSGSAGQSVGNLSVVLPSNESAGGEGGSEGETGNTPNLNINMPNSTVVLETSGSFTADEVTASTAENTLVVGRGVVINKLTVQKGNVKVKKGATIGQIVVSAGGKTIIFYVENGATLPTKLPTGVKIVSMGVSELEKVAAEGGTYQLKEDLPLARPIVVNGKDVTIDLNCHKLTAGVFAENNGEISTGTSDSYVFWVKGGKLTINGEGTVAAQAATYSMAVFASGNGEVVINGGTYTNEGDNGSDLIYAKENAKITINGGTFEATANTKAENATQNKRSALNLKDENNKTASITVKGGKFYEFNPAYNLSEGEGTNFVASGYSSVLNSENYYVVSQGAATVQPWDGTSMQEPMMVGGAYTVETPAQWAWLEANYWNKGLGKDIVLLADIDFNGKNLKGFQFPATFDGRNHSMSDFVIEVKNVYSGSLFHTDALEKSATITVKNLAVKNGKVDVLGQNDGNGGWNGYAGLLFGDVQVGHTVNLENVTIENADVKGVQGVGTLAGFVARQAVLNVKNCKVSGSKVHNYPVAGESGFVCGLVGKVNNKVVFDGVEMNQVVVDGLYATKRKAESIHKFYAKRLDSAVVEGESTITEKSATTVTKTELDADAVVSGQAELAKALVEGKQKISLNEGTYELGGAEFKKGDTSLAYTITGFDKTKCIVKVSESFYLEGRSLALKNLTYQVPAGLTYDEFNFAFIQRGKKFEMSNCVVDGGRLRLNVNEGFIDNCTFNVTDSNGFDGYALYYYGANSSTVKVSNSTFNTAGKAIVMYNESAMVFNLDVENCTFSSSNSATDKAAIQMHTEYGISGTLDITNSTATGFANKNGGLWNEVNNNTQAETNQFDITVDNEKVHSASVNE